MESTFVMLSKNILPALFLMLVVVSGFSPEGKAEANEASEVSLAEGIFYFILRILMMMIATGLLALAINLLMMLGKAIIRFSGKVKDFFVQRK